MYNRFLKFVEFSFKLFYSNEINEKLFKANSKSNRKHKEWEKMGSAVRLDEEIDKQTLITLATLTLFVFFFFTELSFKLLF